jgi:hypothetical protein
MYMLSLAFSFCVWLVDIALCPRFLLFSRAQSVPLSSTILFSSCASSVMSQLTPQQKHDILTQYTSRQRGETLAHILSANKVSASRRTVELWRQRWDGTAASLQHKRGAGRPRILTHAQVMRHIAPRIRAKNRSHAPVVYPTLLPSVTAATGKSMSLRTLERYGKKDLDAAPIHGKKRTHEEGE